MKARRSGEEKAGRETANMQKMYVNVCSATSLQKDHSQIKPQASVSLLINNLSLKGFITNSSNST
jgi:hypothetical protein